MIRQIAGAVANAVLGSIAKVFIDAVSFVLTWLWHVLDDATAVSLHGAGFDQIFGVVLTISAVVGVGLFAIQIIRSVLRRDLGGLARAGRGLLIAFVGAFAAIAITNELLAVADQLSLGILKVTTGGDHLSIMGDLIGTMGMAALVDNPALAVVFGLVLISAASLIWAALILRKILIVVAAVFAPAAFAGSLADISTAWVRRWIETMAALIASKVILVIILVTGYLMIIKGVGSGNVSGLGAIPQAISQVSAGGLLLSTAAFAPWMALRLAHFLGDHIAAMHAHGQAVHQHSAQLAAAMRDPQVRTAARNVATHVASGNWVAAGVAAVKGIARIPQAPARGSYTTDTGTSFTPTPGTPGSRPGTTAGGPTFGPFGTSATTQPPGTTAPPGPSSPGLGDVLRPRPGGSSQNGGGSSASPPSGGGANPGGGSPRPPQSPPGRPPRPRPELGGGGLNV